MKQTGLLRRMALGAAKIRESITNHGCHVLLDPTCNSASLLLSLTSFVCANCFHMSHYLEYANVPFMEQHAQNHSSFCGCHAYYSLLPFHPLLLIVIYHTPRQCTSHPARCFPRKFRHTLTPSANLILACRCVCSSPSGPCSGV